MDDRNATLDAKERIVDAIDAYRIDDLPLLQRVIALLDGQRPLLVDLGEDWLAKYDHHVRVLDEICALTQQSRWSRFGKRRRKIVRGESADFDLFSIRSDEEATLHAPGFENDPRGTWSAGAV